MPPVLPETPHTGNPLLSQALKHSTPAARVAQDRAFATTSGVSLQPFLAGDGWGQVVEQISA